ncbi:hypothetical protein L9F63_005270, partial [Diploptera punctata]
MCSHLHYRHIPRDNNCILYLSPFDISSDNLFPWKRKMEEFISLRINKYTT